MTIHKTKTSIYQSPDDARFYLENIRWPNGASCPNCDNNKVKQLFGSKHRQGLYQCNMCRKQFTVTIGTIFENSKLPLNKLLYATHLMRISNNKISANRMSILLGVTYKTAWLLCERIRSVNIDENGLLLSDINFSKPH